MFIKELARKPELIEVTLDDEDIVKNYGDCITFWMRDFVDLNTYFDFFASQSERDGTKLNAMLRGFILNDKGESVIGEDEELPIDILVAALTKINEALGKSKAKRLTPVTGEL